MRCQECKPAVSVLIRIVGRAYKCPTCGEVVLSGDKLSRRMERTIKAKQNLRAYGDE